MAANLDAFETPGIGRRPTAVAWLLLAPLLLWLALFVIIPTIIMLVFSFSERNSLGEIIYTPNLDNYRRFMTGPQFAPIGIALASALLAGLIAAGAALTGRGRSLAGGALGVAVPQLTVLLLLVPLLLIDMVVLRRFASTFDFGTIASFDPAGARNTFLRELNLNMIFVPLCAILTTFVGWSLAVPGGLHRNNPVRLAVASGLACGFGAFWAILNLCLLVHLRGSEYQSMPLVLDASGPQILRIAVISINYAAFSTAICVLMGYPVAYFIGKSSERWRNLLLMLVMIPFWTSFLVRTFAWLTILRNEGLVNSLLINLGIIAEPLPLYPSQLAVMIGLVYTYLPFMILPIYTSIERLDNALVEAAFDLGASPLRAFNTVIFPLTRPGVVAGIMLVFIPAVGMFAVNYILSGGQEVLIGTVIENQFVKGAMDKPFGSALGIVLLALFVIVYYLMNQRLAKQAG